MDGSTHATSVEPKLSWAAGPAADRGRWSVPAGVDDLDPVAKAVRQALDFGDIATTEAALPDRIGKRRPTVVEAFFNQRSVLIMFIDAAAAQRVTRRLDVRVS